MRNILLIAFCYILAALLFSPLSAAAEETAEVAFVRSQCEALLINWKSRYPADLLAERVTSRALIYNEPADGEGEPLYVRSIKGFNSINDLFSLSLEPVDSNFLSDLEREIFQIPLEQVPVADLRFSLLMRSDEVVTLNVFVQDRIVGQVDLDMNASIFGYIDLLDEKVERFKSILPIDKNDTLEKAWPQLTEPYRRLGVVRARDSVFSVGFLFHLSLADYRGDASTVGDADFYVRGRPIDIVLLRDCMEDYRPGDLIVIHPTENSARSLCVIPVGSITRPKSNINGRSGR